MASFDLYIDRIEDNIQQYKKYRDKCIEDTTYCFSVLENVDNSWVDHNTETFLEKVKKDKNRVNKYFSYMDRLYNEIDIFKNNIVSILHSYGCSGHISTFSYDNSRMRKCINYIENSIYYIEKAVNRILSIVYPSDFKLLDLVNDILRRLYNLKNNLYSYENDIYNLSISISNEISNSRTRKSRIETFNERFETFDYNWTTFEMDIDPNKLQADEATKVFAKESKIDNQEELEINGLSNNVILQQVGKNDMEEIDNVNVTGLDENINYKIANQKEFNNAETEKVVGLNDNVDLAQSRQEKIGQIMSTKVDNLNEGIEAVKSNETSLGLESNEINLGKIEEYNEINNSMDISNKFNNTGELSVKTYDSSANSFDINSAHSYDVSEGINKVDNLSSSINMNNSNNYDVSSNITKVDEINSNNIISNNK